VITHLKYPSSGTRIKLTSQNPAIATALQLSIKNIFGKLFFINAFPDSELKTKFNRDAIYAAAVELDYPDIANRVSKDVTYLNHLTPVVRCLYFKLLYTNRAKLAGCQDQWHPG
jgi:hypothetical protein